MKIEWPYKGRYERYRNRLIKTQYKNAALQDEVARLREMVYDVIPEKSDEPLYRRITNQRRSLKQLHADNALWARLYTGERVKRLAAEAALKGL